VKQPTAIVIANNIKIRFISKHPLVISSTIFLREAATLPFQD
jgi:hypothetical protein